MVTRVLLPAVALCIGASNARAQAQWSVDATPIADISGNARDGSVNFELATRAIRLDDGTIVIADGSALAIRLFDAQGRQLRTAGGRGAGPGEFRNIYWMGRCASDSVFVFDFPSRRMNVFSIAGRYARSFVFPDSGVSGDVMTVACARDGTLAYLVPNFREQIAMPPPSMRWGASLVVAPRPGVPGTRLAAVPSTEMVALVVGGRRGGGPRPLGRGALVAVAGRATFFGSADSAALDVFTADGAPRTVVLSVPRRPSTKAHYESAANEIVAMWNPTLAQQARDAILALPMPDSLPPYSGLVGDQEGLAWLTTSVPGDSATQLLAIDARGRTRATLTLARQIVVHEVGTDYILGVYEDAEGIPHVVAYRLRRGR